MRTFDQEELSQMGEDWRRNDSLEPVARMKRVAELHGCSPEEAAAALGMATPKKKRPKSYDQHVKDDALKAVLLDGEERKSVAERLGVPEGTLNRWVNEARKKQKEFLDYPEKVKTQPASDGEASTSSASLRSAPGGELPRRGKRGQSGLSPQGEGFGGVDLKALAKAQEGLLDFADLYEEIGFLNAEQARKLCEMAEQADYYTEGIRWALERRQ